MDKKLQKASERWIKEGTKFKDSINSWLDTIYIKKENPKKDCPEETREDMADYVLEQLVAFNKEGKQEEFRKLFPPDSDPLRKTFNSDGPWKSVQKVCVLEDGRIIAKLGDYYQEQAVYVIEDDKITLVPDLVAFGVSHSKQYFAKVYTDKIVVHDGWDGAVVCTLSFPTGFDVFSIELVGIEVFSTGKEVVLVTRKGIFLANETAVQLIHSEARDEEDEEDSEEEEYDENEPERPDTVPAEAKWNASENEWELGAKNKDGNPVGEWKWWLAPKGYLCCHTFYEGDGGNLFSFTRFHPDGTPSRSGKYMDGQPFGDLSWFKSDSPTTEHYPPNTPTNVWKTVSTIKNGFTVEEHYYDKEGNEAQKPYISDKNIKISELTQATVLLERFYLEKDWKRTIEKADEIIDAEMTDSDRDLMPVLYYKAYAMYQQNDKEVTDELVELAEDILELCTFSLWPFLSEFNIIRTSLRFAHYLKAQAAWNEEEYDDAWEELSEALDISSPIDDEDLTPYHKMKAQLAEKVDVDAKKEEEEENEAISLDYPHAALSPDDKYIVVGSQSSNHRVLTLKENEWVETANIGPRSSYPNVACFNYRFPNKPLIALGSCHFSRSGTLGVCVEDIEGLTASGWEMDSDALFVVDDSSWIYSMLGTKRGFLLGANNGYIWHKLTSDGDVEYIFIGGTVMSMDMTSNGLCLVVGTHAGQVVVLRHKEAEVAEGKNPRQDPYLITNLKYVDEKRYLFMEDEQPLIW